MKSTGVCKYAGALVARNRVMFWKSRAFSVVRYAQLSAVILTVHQRARATYKTPILREDLRSDLFGGPALTYQAIVISPSPCGAPPEVLCMSLPDFSTKDVPPPPPPPPPDS
jgi:hypothetical protein